MDAGNGMNQDPLSGSGVVPVVDDRVDWSRTFPGIEKPNQAYSLVTMKNVAYEKVSGRRRGPTFGMTSQTQTANTRSTNAASHVGGVMNTGQEQGTGVGHEYEEVTPV